MPLGPPPAFTSADFERSRAERETSNERVVSGIVVVVLAMLLGSELFWSDLAATRFGEYAREFEIPVQVRWATAATLACHACLLLFLHFRPECFSSRKYLIVAMRMALLGGVCWGEWYHPRPDFGLLVPIAFFTVTIVVAGLTYSRRAVLVAGGLAVVTYAAMTLAGPTWPLSLRATGLATQVFLAVTLVTWRIVSSMRTMTGEAVVNERLSRFFSPEIATRIATEPEIAVRAAECRVTVLFSDISGFTSLASRMPPQQVVDLLNGYFPRMVDIIFRHGGTLEKFVGDAVLAVWGAPVGRPDDADRAVTAALEMQAAVRSLNERRIAAGEVPLGVHIGIASGPAAAGYIGTDSYIQYAVIGDTTNVASRICSHARTGEILVGELTWAQLSPGRFVLEPAPPISAKGKDEPVPVHRVRAVAAGGLRQNSEESHDQARMSRRVDRLALGLAAGRPMAAAGARRDAGDAVLQRQPGGAGCAACCSGAGGRSSRSRSAASRASVSSSASSLCSTSRPTTIARSRSNVTAGAPLVQLTLITPVASRNGVPTMKTVTPRGVAKKSASGAGIHAVAMVTTRPAADCRRRRLFFGRLTRGRDIGWSPEQGGSGPPDGFRDRPGGPR